MKPGALLKFDLVLDVALDIHFPAGQSSGESGVLAFPSDCEGKLPIRYNCHCSSVVKVQFYFHHLRRTERIGNKNGDFLVPLHDINFLAVQFVDDVLYSYTA